MTGGGLARTIEVTRTALAEARQSPRIDRREEELEFLPAAVELLESPASPVGRTIALVIVAFLVIALLWGWFGHLDTEAVAEGRIVPGGRVKVIQPMEIGMVRAIHVREGQSVAAGDLLVELDPTESEVDREQVALEIRSSRAEVARVSALARYLETDVRPDLGRDASIDPAELPLAVRRLAGEIAAFETRREELTREGSQLRAQKASIAAELGKTESVLPLIREQEASLRDLAERRAVARWDWMEERKALIDAEQSLIVNRHRLVEAEEAIAKNLKEQERHAAELKRDTLERLNEAREQRDQAALALRKADRRTERLRLRAPVDGVVQELRVHTVGGVVTPAEQLMVVVPAEGLLEIEARVANKDIGFVEAGQRAEIKVESFPFTRYGLIEGKVLDVSADAVQDEEQGLVYAARVAMDESRILVRDRWVPLQAGMAVSVEIKTGKRRLIDFFLSPFLRYQDESLRER